jgi:hypothetical protein
VSATGDQHFDQARRNRDVAEHLLAMYEDDPTYVQWAVTASFYCAVHCLQGYLVDRGRDPRSHVKRANDLADPSNQIPIAVQNAYEALKQYSEATRYRLATFPPDYVRRRIIGRYLKTVTDFVRL